MTSHVKAFTVRWKVPKVLSGELTQTIRPEGKRPVQVGDTILFHGWEGKPRHSKWASWRLRVKVSYVTMIYLSDIGVHDNDWLFLWWCPDLNNLAHLDGFGSGKEMGEWFNHHYSLTTFKPFQIIRWDKDKMEVVQ